MHAAADCVQTTSKESGGTMNEFMPSNQAATLAVQEEDPLLTFSSTLASLMGKTRHEQELEAWQETWSPDDFKAWLSLTLDFSDILKRVLAGTAGTSVERRRVSPLVHSVAARRLVQRLRLNEYKQRRAVHEGVTAIPEAVPSLDDWTRHINCCTDWVICVPPDYAIPERRTRANIRNFLKWHILAPISSTVRRGSWADRAIRLGETLEGDDVTNGEREYSGLSSPITSSRDIFSSVVGGCDMFSSSRLSTRISHGGDFLSPLICDPQRQSSGYGEATQRARQAMSIMKMRRFAARQRLRYVSAMSPLRCGVEVQLRDASGGAADEVTVEALIQSQLWMEQALMQLANAEDPAPAAEATRVLSPRQAANHYEGVLVLFGNGWGEGEGRRVPIIKIEQVKLSSFLSAPEYRKYLHDMQKRGGLTDSFPHELEVVEKTLDDTCDSSPTVTVLLLAASFFSTNPLRRGVTSYFGFRFDVSSKAIIFLSDTDETGALLQFLSRAVTLILSKWVRYHILPSDRDASLPDRPRSIVSESRQSCHRLTASFSSASSRRSYSRRMTSGLVEDCTMQADNGDGRPRAGLSLLKRFLALFQRKKLSEHFTELAAPSAANIIPNILMNAPKLAFNPVAEAPEIEPVEAAIQQFNEVSAIIKGCACYVQDMLQPCAVSVRRQSYSLAIAVECFMHAQLYHVIFPIIVDMSLEEEKRIELVRKRFGAEHPTIKPGYFGSMPELDNFDPCRYRPLVESIATVAKTPYDKLQRIRALFVQVSEQAEVILQFKKPDLNRPRSQSAAHRNISISDRNVQGHNTGSVSIFKASTLCADDVVGLMSLVLISCPCPNLHAQVQYLQLFTSEAIEEDSELDYAYVSFRIAMENLLMEESKLQDNAAAGTGTQAGTSTPNSTAEESA